MPTAHPTGDRAVPSLQSEQWHSWGLMLEHRADTRYRDHLTIRSTPAPTGDQCTIASLEAGHSQICLHYSGAEIKTDLLPS